MTRGPIKRLHAYRDDLADERLRGQVHAGRYVKGKAAQVSDAVASLRRAPADDAMQVTQALFGETLLVFETRDGWCWVQLDEDGYVGYVRADALSENVMEATHRVSVPATFKFAGPDLKSQPAIMLPLNGRLSVRGEENGYLRLAAGGYVYAAHCTGSGTYGTDWVSVAEQFLHVPYLWGGKTSHGLDCSGLVQVALQAAGVAALRDSDMQEESLGTAVAQGTELRRGDLVFWTGHVGIMRDDRILLHANGHHLMVVSEPLDEAIARIASKGSTITSIKRL
jgi:cell wall-associated NlpC family hydrolase